VPCLVLGTLILYRTLISAFGRCFVWHSNFYGWTTIIPLLIFVVHSWLYSLACKLDWMRLSWNWYQSWRWLYVISSYAPNLLLLEGWSRKSLFLRLALRRINSMYGPLSLQFSDGRTMANSVGRRQTSLNLLGQQYESCSRIGTLRTVATNLSGLRYREEWSIWRTEKVADLLQVNQVNVTAGRLGFHLGGILGIARSTVYATCCTKYTCSQRRMNILTLSKCDPKRAGLRIPTMPPIDKMAMLQESVQFLFGFSKL
jgi:hypothetical protein